MPLRRASIGHRMTARAGPDLAGCGPRHSATRVNGWRSGFVFGVCLVVFGFASTNYVRRLDRYRHRSRYRWVVVRHPLRHGPTPALRSTLNHAQASLLALLSAVRAARSNPRPPAAAHPPLTRARRPPASARTRREEREKARLRVIEAQGWRGRGCGRRTGGPAWDHAQRVPYHHPVRAARSNPRPPTAAHALARAPVARLRERARPRAMRRPSPACDRSRRADALSSLRCGPPIQTLARPPPPAPSRARLCGAAARSNPRPPAAAHPPRARARRPPASARTPASNAPPVARLHARKSRR